MNEPKTRKLSLWIGRAVLLAALALMCASLFYFRDFRTLGVWYKKRVALYLLPTLGFCGLSLIYPRIREQAPERVLRAALMAAGIVLSTFMFQRMTWGITWGYPVAFLPRYILFNISLAAILAAFLWLLIWDVRWVVPVLYWLLFASGYLYACVYQFRGVAFKPMDLLTINTALAVAGQYQFPIKAKTCFWAMFGVCLTVFSLWTPPKKKDLAGRLTKTAALVLAGIWFCVAFFSSYVEKIGLTTTAWEEFAERVNAEQGTLATLTKEVWDLRQVKPKDYEAANLQNADERLLQKEPYGTAQTKPNVIVVINESLSDLGSLWQINLAEDRDPLPYIHSLMDQTVCGNLYVSVYGGSTCNTEHNFLTGTFSAPRMYMPLLTTVRNDTPSLIWQLKALDYTAVAMHPQLATNYQRDIIYPRLGFDDFISIDSEYFQNAQTIRNYVVDQETYDAVISLFEQKKPNEPLLVYDLTMQNHGPYAAELVSEEFKVENQNVSAFNAACMEEYLTLMKETDRAFEQLISYFETYEEPTVILLFGDHQGKLEMDEFPKSTTLSEAEQALTPYITPFMIWANYPIESEYVEAVSINYLAALLLEKAGLPLTGYDRWQLEMLQKYPVVVQHGYADSEGRFFEWDEQEWPEELKLMNHVRYNRLYDPENRLPALDFVEPAN